MTLLILFLDELQIKSILYEVLLKNTEMKVIADFHIHGRYSRATSKQLDIQNLEKYGRIKGLNLIGTGDFTHPLWLKELKENLSEDGSGILKTKSGFNFILQTEISLMYSQGGKGRKIHLILLAKNFDIVEQINSVLSKRGRLDYDGRPIFGINSIEFAEMMKRVDKDIEMIPAHAWTPWFGIFGSMSGFDSVEECFAEQSKHIKMIETGLSSDPQMNWRLSSLDKYSLVSNSDCHSFWPWRLGRECNIAELKELTYDNFINAIVSRNGFLETIEVDPAYGKYHFDGHRNCGVSMSPKEASVKKNICPVCRRGLTIGVLHRVEELADRPDGFVPKGAVTFRRIIPLSEILAAVHNSAVASKGVWQDYFSLIKVFGSEMNVLLEAPLEDMKKAIREKTAELIIKNREGKLDVRPGFDGEYGKLLLNKEEIEVGIEDGKRDKENKVAKKGKNSGKIKQKGLEDFM